MPQDEPYATPADEQHDTPREDRPEGDQQDPNDVTGDVGRRVGGTTGAEPQAPGSGGGAPEER